MNNEQQQQFNRGKRLVKELEEVLSRYQKLRFFLDTTDEIIDGDRFALETQATVMEEYINILNKRLQQTIY